MKLKYYLRGLGVGIICTAIIMGIATSGKQKEKLTDAEIIERARILGMVMEDQNAPEEEETAPEPEEQDKDSNNISMAQPPESQEPVEPQEPAEPEIKVIEVLPGEYSDVVCRKLFEAGLIPDATAFNEYLTSTGLDQNIMVGAHQIPMGASQDEIIRILGEKAE